MLKAADKEKLKKIYKLDVDKLEAAIKDEKEVDYEVSEMVVLTPDEATARDDNKIKEGKTEGEKTAVITFVKEVGKKMGFEPKGERIGDLVTGLQEQFNKGNDDKVKTLQEQVNLLTKDKEGLTTQLAAEKERAEKSLFESELIGHFPAKRSNALKDREYLAIMNGEIQFKIVNGNRVAVRNGETLKDPNTHAPLPVNQVVADYFTERKWISEEAGAGGRGGEDSKGGASGGRKKYSEVLSAWQKENPEGNEMSPAFIDHVGKVAKDTPDFEWHG